MSLSTSNYQVSYYHTLMDSILFYVALLISFKSFYGCVTGVPAFTGCYHDAIADADTNFIPFTNSDTVEDCVKQCHQYDYPFAAYKSVGRMIPLLDFHTYFLLLNNLCLTSLI